jgi:hypothetical protein
LESVDQYILYIPGDSEFGEFEVEDLVFHDLFLELLAKVPGELHGKVLLCEDLYVSTTFI